MRHCLPTALIVLVANIAQAQPGDATRGERLFGNCIACHSLQPDKNLTGPSLSGLFGRNAGGLESFARYSDALKSSGLVWNDKTLDTWLADPERAVPGNEMPFAGIKSAQDRADIIAYLKETSQPSSRTAQKQAQGGGGMMGGMMRNAVPNLKKVDNATRVQSVRYCGDTYEIATADGKKRKFFERNLRFKTDSSEDGPTKGAPALVPAGMAGDRADVIFAAPEEFGQFVIQGC